MPLAAGTRLGTYEVIAPLGAGGMGEVYRARDSKLNREVAIKVLPDSLAQDPATLARFEREAHAVAALSHPNILAIHDFASERGITYAVTELLEGETLRERLRTTIPGRKAIEIAISVARGVAAAHERGIIHRDLKPENIFLTNDGVVKILDFGLAKAMDPGGAEAPGPGRDTAADETKLSAHTTPGTVMGTVGYMAPEQVRGQVVDARADLFALGAVLYEMLAGERAFIRETAAETMTAILKEEPADFVPTRAVSPSLDRIVRHCLEKQPAHRFQTARDVAFALETLSTSSPSAPAVAMEAATTASVRAAARERLLWAAATLSLAAVAGWLAMIRSSGTAVNESENVRRASLVLPTDYAFRPTTPADRRIAVSPDGQRVAFVLAKRGPSDTTLFVHSFETGSAVAVPDSSGATGPTWSPDGKMLAFLQGDDLMVVDASGGKPTKRIGSVGAPVWGPNGDILVPDLPAKTLRLLAASATEFRSVPGSPSAPLAGPLFPTWLPDGRRFFLLWGENSRPPVAYLGDLTGSPWREVTGINFERDSLNPSFVAGHLVHARDQMIVARPFDPAQATIGSDMITLGGPVDGAFRNSAAHAITKSVLVYQPLATQVNTKLVWYDQSGARLSQLSDDAGYSNLELSPDDRQLLVGIIDPATRTRDIWTVDTRRGIRSRVTSEPDDERAASWFPDSKAIAYRGKNRDLFLKPLGAGAERALQVDGRSKDPRGVSIDGKYLVYRVSGETTSNDLWIKPLNPEGAARPLIASNFNEADAEISPDGHWLAYVSDKNGAGEVYVTAFPSATGEVQVSSGGGQVPKWGRDGKALFYLSPDRTMMRARINLSGGSVDLENPERLFPTESVRGPGPQFVVTRDGRFIVNTEVPSTDQGTLNVVFNWQALLKKK